MILEPLIWTDQLDPGDFRDFSISYATRLAAMGDTLSASAWVLPADAIAAGLQVGPDSFDPQNASVWFQVAGGNQADANWNGDGCTFEILNQLTTTGGRSFERTALLTVRQR